MSDDLETALQDIHGVGEAKTGEIMAVINEHGIDVDTDDVRDRLEDALDYHEQGDHSYAEKFVRQALDAL